MPSPETRPDGNGAATSWGEGKMMPARLGNQGRITLGAFVPD
jgi:hypothetical protein